MADARTVANRFLELASTKGRSLTPMQLLKLVYIAHGWMLGLTDQPLINQKVEAWQYGPVIRDLYNSVRMYGRDPINAPVWSPGSDLTPAQRHMIDQVYDIYGDLNGIQLSNITHMSGTPWDRTYRPGAFGSIIDNAVIEDHYKQLARERNEAEPVK